MRSADNVKCQVLSQENSTWSWKETQAFRSKGIHLVPSITRTRSPLMTNSPLPALLPSDLLGSWPICRRSLTFRNVVER